MAELNKDLLNYAIEQGIIDISHIQDIVDMNKKQEILKNHPYSIWEGKDKKWHTYLPDEKKGRVPRKRNSHQEIEDVIVDYYKNQAGFTFHYWWDKWVEKQKKYGVSNNTLVMYRSEYKRFFEGEAFSELDIRDITEEDITEFMINTVKRLNLKEKGARNLSCYVSGVLKHARIKKVIKENPYEYVETRMFLKFCDKSKKSTEQRTVSQSELKKILEVIQIDKKRTPTYMSPYAIELAIYTGMRMGEITGLMWEDVQENNGYLLIRKSEKYDRIKKEYYTSSTKTGNERVFPLTEEIKRILNEVKKVQLATGKLSEYVFAVGEEKTHSPAIIGYLRHRCERLGIPRKSVHAIRRTVNSKLKVSGVSTVVAASLLGHTRAVNENNYTYDTSGMDYKRKVVSDLYKTS